MRSVTALAPVRLDLSGGTLDIWPIHLCVAEPGVTVNVALDLGVRAEVGPLPDGRVRIESVDLGRTVEYDDTAALLAAVAAGTCPLRLLSSAVGVVFPDGGVELVTEATSPPGAGLGGSSALLMAVLAALCASAGSAPDHERLVRLGQDIETRLLRKLTGYQDFYPPLYGGCLAVEGRVGARVVERLPVDLAALGARLRLVYTGEPHVSTETNWSVVRAFLEREDHAVRSMERIAEISRAQRDALRIGDIDTALACLADDGEMRRAMAPGVTTETIDQVTAGVRDAGALGVKICGAGGGGCLMVALADADPGPVDSFLTETGLATIPVSLVERGLVLETKD